MGNSVIWFRVLPLALFVALTGLQGKIGPLSIYWIYALKTALAAGLLFWLAGRIPEMKWRWSWDGLGIGVLVFILWIGLTPVLTRIGIPESFLKIGGDVYPWNPLTTWGDNSWIAWTFISIRLLGSTFVVPFIEEVFYRSFVYRYIIKPDFLSVPIKQVHGLSFLITSAIFASTHREWLAAFLCGLIYQWLACRKNGIGETVFAHGTTNFLLGLWVISQSAWHFW
jgi:hypothetical protein